MTARDARRGRAALLDVNGGEIRTLRVCIGMPRLGHAGGGWVYALTPTRPAAPRRVGGSLSRDG